MKKMYVKPSMEVVEFYSALVINAGSVPVDNNGGDGGGNIEPEATGRRGGWGSLWN